MFTKKNYIVKLNHSHAFFNIKPTFKYLGNDIYEVSTKNYSVSMKLDHKPIIHKTKMTLPEWEVFTQNPFDAIPTKGIKYRIFKSKQQNKKLSFIQRYYHKYFLKEKIESDGKIKKIMAVMRGEL